MLATQDFVIRFAANVPTVILYCRAVFVPYFRYLVAPAVEHLDAARAATEPKKKKRKNDRDGGTAIAVSAAEAALLWRLRLQVSDKTHVRPPFCASTTSNCS